MCLLCSKKKTAMHTNRAGKYLILIKNTQMLSWYHTSSPLFVQQQACWFWQGNPTNTEIWIEFKHPAGWGEVCYQPVTVPNHCRRRGQVIWTEKPGTTAPTQLASTFPNSQASCEFRKGGFHLLCKRAENSPFFAQKLRLVEPHTL